MGSREHTSGTVLYKRGLETTLEGRSLAFASLGLIVVVAYHCRQNNDKNPFFVFPNLKGCPPIGACPSTGFPHAGPQPRGGRLQHSELTRN